MTTDQIMTAIEAATVRTSEFSILLKEKRRKEKRKSGMMMMMSETGFCVACHTIFIIYLYTGYTYTMTGCGNIDCS